MLYEHVRPYRELLLSRDTHKKGATAIISLQKFLSLSLSLRCCNIVSRVPAKIPRPGHWFFFLPHRDVFLVVDRKTRNMGAAAQKKPLRAARKPTDESFGADNERLRNAPLHVRHVYFRWNKNRELVSLNNCFIYILNQIRSFPKKTF